MAEPPCIDLRPWAKQHRYRWRYEESYGAEKPENRGDGRWYVEIICRYGLIYPKGGATLLAYATRGVKRHVAKLGLELHQTDGDADGLLDPSEHRLSSVLKRLAMRAICFNASCLLVFFALQEPSMNFARTSISPEILSTFNTRN